MSLRGETKGPVKVETEGPERPGAKVGIRAIGIGMKKFPVEIRSLPSQVGHAESANQGMDAMHQLLRILTASTLSGGTGGETVRAY